MESAHLLLDWYKQNKRDLPWRLNKDPYRILVSEIMLQQTRVESVIEKFNSFISKFPTVKSLALAKENTVLKQWEGLGYYRRARYLKAACEAIYFKHQSVFPRFAKELRNLPGIGDYTSCAISSIAFEEPIPVVDGNVMRVICRHFGIRGNPYRMKTNRLIRQNFNEGFFIDSNPGDFNQAMMELGALICTPISPKCDICPIEKSCKAKSNDLINELPELKSKQKPTVVYLYFLIWPHEDYGIQLTDKTWKNYQSGYKSLPWIEASNKLSEEQIKSSFLKNWSFDIKNKFTQVSFRHGITNYKLLCNLIIPSIYQSLVLKRQVLESGLLKKALKLLK
tara:strand:- start:344 stop:1354 length:1011 start_codon:yes stop_codon:yes gene_type:complete